MTNANHDRPDEQIPLPKRASVEQFDIMLIDLSKKGKSNEYYGKRIRKP